MYVIQNETCPQTMNIAEASRGWTHHRQLLLMQWRHPASLMHLFFHLKQCVWGWGKPRPLVPQYPPLYIYETIGAGIHTITLRGEMLENDLKHCIICCIVTKSFIQRLLMFL